MGESFLDLTGENLDDAKELLAVGEGEYTIRLVDWRSDSKGSITQYDKNEHPYIMPIFEVIDCEEAEYAKNFSHFLRLTYEDMTKRERNNAQWNLKAFCICFGIDYSQRIDYEEYIGAVGDALLTVSPDEGYGEQNRVKKFLNPK